MQGNGFKFVFGENLKISEILQASSLILSVMQAALFRNNDDGFFIRLNDRARVQNAMKGDQQAVRRDLIAEKILKDAFSDLTVTDKDAFLFLFFGENMKQLDSNIGAQNAMRFGVHSDGHFMVSKP